jgi:SAM-dependent methyltransferase
VKASTFQRVMHPALVLWRFLVPKQVPSFQLYRDMLADCAALEIGGPSRIFSSTGRVPVYPLLRSLDGCNFSTSTTWEGRIEAGPGKYAWIDGRPAGHQYVMEASRLDAITADRYDAVLSSHCVEHLANPLAALAQWRRVLCPGGYLVMVVPHRNATFDHQRPLTTFEHLLDDFNAGRTEDDQTHLAEVLAHHDLKRDAGAGNLQTFTSICQANFENRRMHHHVFCTELVVKMVDHAGFRVLDVASASPCHIVVLARKPENGERPDNAGFLDPDAAWRQASPFSDDKIPVPAPA